MMTLTELTKWRKDMSNIIFDIHISINNAKRLSRDVYKEEIHVKNHGFFQHHFYQLNFISIIQISKLFDSRSTQKRSFTKLCNKLINEPYDKELTSLLRNNKAKVDDVFKNKSEVKSSCKTILQLLLKMDSDIKKVTDARDKVYAHTDPDIRVSNVSIAELETLSLTAAMWYNEIIGRFFGVTFFFQGTDDWDIDYPLKELSEVMERRVNDV